MVGFEHSWSYVDIRLIHHDRLSVFEDPSVLAVPNLTHSSANPGLSWPSRDNLPNMLHVVVPRIHAQSNLAIAIRSGPYGQVDQDKVITRISLYKGWILAVNSFWDQLTLDDMPRFLSTNLTRSRYSQVGCTCRVLRTLRSICSCIRSSDRRPRDIRPKS